MTPNRHDKRWESHPAVRTGRELPFGDRAADVAATVLGGWPFFWGMTAFIALWMVAGNLFGFDPYPHQFLTLLLSLQASYAAPLILMSQNRHGAVDADLADHDRKILRAIYHHVRKDKP